MRSTPHPSVSVTRRTAAAIASAGAMALLLAACGGGDAGDDGPTPQAAATNDRVRMLAAPANAAGWVAVAEPDDRLMQNLSIPADAPTRGMWSGVGTWPLNGLHQAVLPDGQVLTWGTNPQGDAQNGRWFDTWDPNRGLFDAGAHVTTYDPARQDSFCAAATYLPSGQLLITGGNGDVTSTTYTPAGGAMARGGNAADSRWYATMLTLADGRPIIVGGITPYTEGQWTNVPGALTEGLSSMTPEVYENGAWRTLLNAQSRTAWGPDYLRASIPKAWLAPDGRVFGVSTDQMWYVDANGAGGQGVTTIVGGWKAPPSGSFTNDNAPNAGPTSTGVMYAPGRVLIVGGNAYQNGNGYAGSRQATVVDLNGGGAARTEQPPMALGRHYAGVVVLADGKVLVSGGETRANNDTAFGAYAAELWNPATGTWSTMASSTVFRGYHSQAGLLTNGTVLVTGGGTPGPLQLKGDVFYPPSLFRSVNGTAQLAPRPRLIGISGLSHANGAQMQFDLASTGAISQVALIGLSVGTHSFNSGQRRIPMTFTQDQFRITATVPGSTLVPPGYYQVVAVDASGVPSRGTIVAVGQGVQVPQVPVTPYTPPTISDVIDAPVITAGGSATYTVAAQPGVTYSWDFGDGTPATPFSATASVTRTFSSPGVYAVTLSARDSAGRITTRTFLQAVGTAATAGRPTASSAVALESRSGASARLWVVNPDANTVAVIDTASNVRVAEIGVGQSPRSVAIAPDGRVWVTNKDSSSLSLISPASLTVSATVALPAAAQPHGLAFAPGGSAFVALEATGQLLKLDPANGALQGTLSVGPHPRHVSATANGALVLVSRFITNPLPGEGTATVDTSAAGAEVVVVNAGAMTLNRTIVLRHSDKVDNENQGAGVPNYLAAAVISPDGARAWVPSKQDNIRRGTLRSGQPLDFQNSVRAISSRIDMAALAEDLSSRVDHDNASLGTAAAYHPSGAYLFVALETSRQVAVVDAFRGTELLKFDVGRAPQALTLAADGRRLYAQNFMDRSVSVIDLGPLVTQGLTQFPTLATVATAVTERLSPQVLLGKQLFYDARDPRLARDSYMSCATCHADAGHDGRTWDFTSLGEGLRNTPPLKGRAGLGQGFIHWSANFDETQDFEGQIRALAGGTGLMSDAQFNTGSRSAPLGDRKAGVSADLDALSAYLASLNTFDRSPLRNPDGTLTAAALAGKTVFANANCASCHTGVGFTISGAADAMRNIGTLKPASGQRLGGPLTGVDVPTLRDVWKSGPYLHDGSAPTLAAAVQAHAGTTIGTTDLNNLVSYLQQIGGDEPGPGTPVAGTGTGLQGSYFGNPTLTGAPVVTRTEVPWFDWGVGAPAPGIGADNFSVRWTGEIQAVEGGTYQFRTVSDDGVRVWVNGVLLIDNWTVHAPTTDTSGGISLTAGQRVPIVVEFQEFGGGAVLQLSWLRPGAAWLAVPAAQLYTPGAPANQAPTAVLTAPAANASVPAGAALTLTATAADPDGTVARVEFYAGTTLLGTDTTAPYSQGWTPTTAGAVSLTARAFDNVGAATTSAAVAVTVTAGPPSENLAPSATLATSHVSPWESLPAVNNNIVPASSADRSTGAYGNWQGEALYGRTDWVSFSWAAPRALNAFEVYWWNDSAGIATPTAAQVEYWNGSAWVGLGAPGLALNTFNRLSFAPVNTTSIRVSMSSPRATGILEVRIWGTAGSPTPVNQAPTVSLTAPVNNTSVAQGTTVTLTAVAADADGTVGRVEFYAGATLLGTDASAPYSLGWTPTTAGAVSLTARAIDNAAAATTSAAVAVNVTAPAPALPAGALAEWTFDTASGSSAPDTSGNGRTLTLGSGAGVTAAGRSGAALSMAGPASPGGATTAGSVVNTAASFSVSGWIRFDQLPTCWNQIMASQDGVTVSGFYLGIVPPCGGGQPRATFAMMGADRDSSTTFRITDTATIVTGTWYHLVAVRDASANTMALYVNGRLAGTLSNTSKWAANGAFAVGRAKFSGGLRDPAYAAIDGVRAYGRALSAAEVTTLFQAAR